jgi:Tfp pilus assembly protein PilO
MARKRLSENGKKQNIIKYATWNVMGIGHKEEKLKSVLSEKQIKIAAITELKRKLNGINATNNYILI